MFRIAIRLSLALAAWLPLAGCCTTSCPAPAATAAAPMETPLQFAPDIAERLRKLPATPIDYDRALLDERETKVVQELIEASKLIEEIYWRQSWEGNAALRARLQQMIRDGSPGAAEALAFAQIYKGPWDALDEHHPVIGSSRRPPGAGFYPADMTKEEFETWIVKHPADKEAFESLFTVIERRPDGGLAAVPYSKAYGDLLVPVAEKLRSAARLTANESLRVYLMKRADALLSNDYYESDIAWMDLDSDIEVVVGPYEVYDDALFGYKASFESFITVRDRDESQKLAIYERHLADMERNLPLPDEHKNPNRGSSSPIKVVQEIFTAGDARDGVQTAAFNLPNDERVREAKGSKKVLLKNVMQAKYRQSGKPIADRILDAKTLAAVTFDAFFTQVLFHELSHGLGPGLILGPDGKRVDTRLLLKTHYGVIEECKADVLGVWNMLYAIEKGLLNNVDERALFATNAGLHFRSMRFGLNEAHGRGTAVQWNWLRERGAIVLGESGRYSVDTAKYREATRTLANELLMIEATGDFEREGRLLEAYGKSNPEIEGLISRLTGIPVDLTPVFVAAGEK